MRSYAGFIRDLNYFVKSIRFYIRVRPEEAGFVGRNSEEGGDQKMSSGCPKKRRAQVSGKGDTGSCRTVVLELKIFVELV